MQITKKSFAPPGMEILLVLLLFFDISCQKEIATGTKKTNDSTNANDLATTGTLAKSSIIYTDVKPDS